jgi:hypothetical protein
VGTPIPPPSTPSNQTPLVHLLVGAVAVGLAFMLLWVSAPVWEGFIRPAPSGPPPPQDFVLLNTTVWHFSGSPPCWLNQVGPGATLPASAVFEAKLHLTYPLGNTSSPCAIESVAPQTSGFTLFSSNTPLVIASGQVATLEANVTVPSTSYTGSLTLLVTVSSG